MLGTYFKHLKKIKQLIKKELRHFGMLPDHYLVPLSFAILSMMVLVKYNNLVHHFSGVNGTTLTWRANW